MDTLTNPRWLLLVNTLPLLLLSYLSYRQYTLIESLLDTYSKSSWLGFAVATALYLGGTLGLGIYLDRRKQKINAPIVTCLFLIGLVYLYYSVTISQDLVPWSIPDWLGGEDLLLYVSTCAMPTLGYGLLTGVHLSLSEREEEPDVALDLTIAVVIPLLIYLMVTGMIPIMGGNSNLGTHLSVILMAMCTVMFLFFLVRGLYVLIRRRGPVSDEYRLFWLVPLTVIAPLGGLALNAKMFNIFGDFTSPVWYILAGLNGLLLCLPNYDNKLYRLYIFLGRVALGVFVLYFFIVFLPFLPLAVAAVLAVGLGFLMLTPLLLLPLQVNTLREDYRYLRQYFQPAFLATMSAIAFSMIPLVITITYVRDQAVLDNALAYVYAPGGAPVEEYAAAIRPAALDRTLAAIDLHKGSDNNFGFGSGTPYLSTYYRWIVLDNLTLSDAKMNELRMIFQGEAQEETTSFRRRSNDVDLTAATVETEWDAGQEVWSSWVELELTNDSAAFNRGEYRTQFDLPPGVFIADYYLEIEGRREYGILAEKRAATWVYNNIVNGNRDPGFLRYVSADRIALNVFPIARGQTRRTGIRFLHKEPVTLRLDGRELTLGTGWRTPYIKLADQY